METSGQRLIPKSGNRFSDKIKREVSPAMQQNSTVLASALAGRAWGG